VKSSNCSKYAADSGVEKLKRVGGNVNGLELEKEGRSKRRKGLSHCRKGRRVYKQIKEGKWNITIK
jgi:hypothetical protein